MSGVLSADCTEAVKNRLAAEELWTPIVFGAPGLLALRADVADTSRQIGG